MGHPSPHPSRARPCDGLPPKRERTKCAPSAGRREQGPAGWRARTMGRRQIPRRFAQCRSHATSTTDPMSRLPQNHSPSLLLFSLWEVAPAGSLCFGILFRSLGPGSAGRGRPKGCFQHLHPPSERLVLSIVLRGLEVNSGAVAGTLRKCSCQLLNPLGRVRGCFPPGRTRTRNQGENRSEPGLETRGTDCVHVDPGTQRLLQVRC